MRSPEQAPGSWLIVHVPVDPRPCVAYKIQVLEVRQTEVFAGWVAGLRDERARARIGDRILRLASGLVGDAKFFDGIGELRIDYGPGYRLYFVRRGGAIVVLLCGGDKGSQRRDIRKAKLLAKDLED
jgi:putative addiction module killer protein